MRKTVIAALVLATAYLCYAVWPLYGLHRISAAVSQRDAAELSRRMDLPSLRRSLVEQIGRTYLKVSGRDKGLREFEIQIALRAAAGIAEPRINALLEPENLITLLSEGGAGDYSQVGISAPRLEAPNLRNLWRVISNTERFGRDFHIIMPLTADAKSGYRIHLRLDDWTWKLAGIGLPEAVQVRIAKEIETRTRG